MAAQLFVPTRLFRLADADEVRRLIWMFNDDLIERMPELERALVTGNAGAAYDAAHFLKGGAAVVGAPRIAGLCAEICDLTRGGSTAEAAPLYAPLAATAAQTRGLLLTYLG
ncbi:MAG TPA: Hpt domain-containing protein [Solirubrobacteraceae bacterium]|jgi:HPt (histidine-containing phosphotransfer) domain-containing protein|nr:Hpt domain-containing protein [Solirubrobacteraceae bacterium]